MGEHRRSDRRVAELRPWRRPSSPAPTSRSTRSTSPTRSSGPCPRRSARAPSPPCGPRRPISFHEERDFVVFPQGPGYCALTRHADVLDASRQPELFCSGQGREHRRHAGRVPRVLRLDDQHGRPPPRPPAPHRLPRLHAPAARPTCRTTSSGAAAEIVDDVIEKGECDFVTDVAAALPLRIICDMMGIPESQYAVRVRPHEHHPRRRRPRVRRRTSDEVDPGAPHRRRTSWPSWSRSWAPSGGQNPTDDLTSALVNAEVDGERLTDAGAGVVLRPARRGRQRDHPQRHQPRHAGAHRAPRPEGSAGWPTSTAWRRPRSRRSCAGPRRSSTSGAPSPRTAPRLGGQEISEGDKVVLWYDSANRDEAVFDDPFRFDVGRDAERARRLRRPRPALLPRAPTSPAARSR